MEYALSNDSISIKVSTAGGSFTSIEAGGREYLWQGDPAVWSGQAPICFPICGGLRDNNAMTFAGHHVKLARHGFARKQEWKLLSQSENELGYAVSRYQLFVDGTEYWLIDQLNQILRVGGKDYYKQIRSLL